MDLSSALEVSRTMLSSGASTEEVLAKLRERGCSKIDSIRVLMQITNIPLGEAKRVVHLSKAWEQERETHDAFHKSLEDEINRGE